MTVLQSGKQDMLQRSVSRRLENSNVCQGSQTLVILSRGIYHGLHPFLAETLLQPTNLPIFYCAVLGDLYAFTTWWIFNFCAWSIWFVFSFSKVNNMLILSLSMKHFLCPNNVFISLNLPLEIQSGVWPQFSWPRGLFLYSNFQLSPESRSGSTWGCSVN